MARPYPDTFEAGNSSPLTPASAASQAPVSFAANVNRKKTRKWVEAKPVDYGGDDWGDEDEDELPMPAPAQTGGAHQSLGQTGHHVAQGYGDSASIPSNKKAYGDLPPLPIEAGTRNVTDPVGGRMSYMPGDERRAFSGGHAPMPGAFEARPVPSNIYGASDFVKQATNNLPPLQTSTQVSAASEVANTSSTTSDIYSRRDFSPSAVPSPLQARTYSPAPQSAVSESAVSQYPPRKSSFSQVAPTNAPEQQPVRTVSPYKPWTRDRSQSPGAAARAQAAGGKGHHFVRPAEIYRRMEEEREKERQSLDSSRPSLESIVGKGSDRSASPQKPLSQDVPRNESKLASANDGNESYDTSRRPELESIKERKSEHAFDGFDPTKTRESMSENQAPPPAAVPLPAESPEEVRRLSTSPKLPDLNRISGFGLDMFAPYNPDTAPAVPPITKAKEDVASTKPQHPALGISPVVRQAFEAGGSSMPETPGSQQSPLERTRSESTDTSGISPIMSQVPALSSLDSTISEVNEREATQPASEDNGGTVPGSSTSANVMSGASNNVIARRSVEANAGLSSPRAGNGLHTSRPARGDSPARNPIVGDAGSIVHAEEAHISGTTSDRSSTPSDVAASSFAPPRPTAEREQSFRPALPGGWVSYATTNSDPSSDKEGATPQRSGTPNIRVDSGNSPVSPISEEDDDDFDLTPTTTKKPLHQSALSAAAAHFGLRDKSNPTSPTAPVAGGFSRSIGENNNLPPPDPALAPTGNPYASHPLDPRLRAVFENSSALQPPITAWSSEPTTSGSSAPPTPPPKDTQAESRLAGKPEYFPPVVPLKPNSQHDPTKEEALAAPVRPAILPTLSTQTSPNDQPSDRLRKEIIKSLSPTAETIKTFDTFPPAESTKGAATVESPDTGVRESTYLENVYDEYGDSNEDEVQANEKKRSMTIDTTPALKPNQPPITRTSIVVNSPVVNTPSKKVSAPVSAVSPLSSSGPEDYAPRDTLQRPPLIGNRFSWEAGPEEVNAKPATLQNEPQLPTPGSSFAATPDTQLRNLEDLRERYLEQGPLPTPITEQVGPPAFTKPAPKSSNLRPASEISESTMSPRESSHSGGRPDSGLQTSTGPTDADVTARTSAPIPEAEESSMPAQGSSLLASEKAVGNVSQYPVAATPSEEHPALSSGLAPLRTSPLNSHPPQNVIPSPVAPKPRSSDPITVMQFRDILGIQQPEQRIKAFNDTRKQFSHMDTGLRDWILRTSSGHEEFAGLPRPSSLPGSGVVARVGKGSSGPATPVHQPYQQHYNNANPQPGSASMQQSPSNYSGSQHGFLPSSAGQKGKDLLHTAGVFGGKATNLGKGLLAKGKNKLRGSAGGEKDSPPLGPSPTSNKIKANEGRRTSWGLSMPSLALSRGSTKGGDSGSPHSGAQTPTKQPPTHENFAQAEPAHAPIIGGPQTEAAAILAAPVSPAHTPPNPPSAFAGAHPLAQAQGPTYLEPQEDIRPTSQSTNGSDKYVPAPIGKYQPSWDPYNATPIAEEEGFVYDYEGAPPVPAMVAVPTHSRNVSAENRPVGLGVGGMNAVAESLAPVAAPIVQSRPEHGPAEEAEEWVVVDREEVPSGVANEDVLLPPGDTKALRGDAVPEGVAAAVPLPETPSVSGQPRFEPQATPMQSRNMAQAASVPLPQTPQVATPGSQTGQFLPQAQTVPSQARTATHAANVPLPPTPGTHVTQSYSEFDDPALKRPVGSRTLGSYESDYSQPTPGFQTPLEGPRPAFGQSRNASETTAGFVTPPQSTAGLATPADVPRPTLDQSRRISQLLERQQAVVAQQSSEGQQPQMTHQRQEVYQPPPGPPPGWKPLPPHPQIFQAGNAPGVQQHPPQPSPGQQGPSAQYLHHTGQFVPHQSPAGQRTPQQGEPFHPNAEAQQTQAEYFAQRPVNAPIQGRPSGSFGRGMEMSQDTPSPQHSGGLRGIFKHMRRKTSDIDNAEPRTKSSWSMGSRSRSQSVDEPVRPFIPRERSNTLQPGEISEPKQGEATSSRFVLPPIRRISTFGLLGKKDTGRRFALDDDDDSIRNSRPQTDSAVEELNQLGAVARGSQPQSRSGSQLNLDRNRYSFEQGNGPSTTRANVEGDGRRPEGAPAAQSMAGQPAVVTPGPYYQGQQVGRTESPSIPARAETRHSIDLIRTNQPGAFNGPNNGPVPPNGQRSGAGAPYQRASSLDSRSQLSAPPGRPEHAPTLGRGVYLPPPRPAHLRERSMDTPPSAAQRYPELFRGDDDDDEFAKETSVDGLPANYYQAPVSREEAFLPRTRTNEYQLPGVGPPPEEPRTGGRRSRRNSAILKEIGGRLSRSLSRERSSAVDRDEDLSPERRPVGGRPIISAPYNSRPLPPGPSDPRHPDARTPTTPAGLYQQHTRNTSEPSLASEDMSLTTKTRRRSVLAMFQGSRRKSDDALSRQSTRQESGRESPVSRTGSIPLDQQGSQPTTPSGKRTFFGAASRESTEPRKQSLLSRVSTREQETEQSLQQPGKKKRFSALKSMFAPPSQEGRGRRPSEPMMQAYQDLNRNTHMPSRETDMLYDTQSPQSPQYANQPGGQMSQDPRVMQGRPPTGNLDRMGFMGAASAGLLPPTASGQQESRVTGAAPSVETQGIQSSQYTHPRAAPPTPHQFGGPQTQQQSMPGTEPTQNAPSPATAQPLRGPFQAQTSAPAPRAQQQTGQTATPIGSASAHIHQPVARPSPPIQESVSKPAGVADVAAMHFEDPGRVPTPPPRSPARLSRGSVDSQRPIGVHHQRHASSPALQQASPATATPPVSQQQMRASMPPPQHSNLGPRLYEQPQMGHSLHAAQQAWNSSAAPSRVPMTQAQQVGAADPQYHASHQPPMTSAQFHGAPLGNLGARSLLDQEQRPSGVSQPLDPQASEPKQRQSSRLKIGSLIGGLGSRVRQFDEKRKLSGQRQASGQERVEETPSPGGYSPGPASQGRRFEEPQYEPTPIPGGYHLVRGDGSYAVPSAYDPRGLNRQTGPHNTSPYGNGNQGSSAVQHPQLTRAQDVPLPPTPSDALNIHSPLAPPSLGSARAERPIIDTQNNARPWMKGPRTLSQEDLIARSPARGSADQQPPYQLSLPEDSQAQRPKKEAPSPTPHRDMAAVGGDLAAHHAVTGRPVPTVAPIITQTMASPPPQPTLQHPQSPATYPLPREDLFSPVNPAASQLPPPPPPKWPDGHAPSEGLDRSNTKASEVSRLSGQSGQAQLNIPATSAQHNVGGQAATTPPSLQITPRRSYEQSPENLRVAEDDPYNATPRSSSPPKTVAFASAPAVPAPVAAQVPLPSEPGSSQPPAATQPPAAAVSPTENIPVEGEGVPPRHRRASQEEKILVSGPPVREDEDVIMSATSYPGMEWNPYAAGEGGYVSD